MNNKHIQQMSYITVEVDRKWKLLSHVWLRHYTLHGILHEFQNTGILDSRIPEWVAFPFSKKLISATKN